MKWFLNDLKAALAELKHGATWLVIGLIAAFGLFAFIIAHFAFQTDSLLRYLHISVSGCRELTNGPIIFLFSSMIFFILTVITTFGEIQRYCFFRAHKKAREAKRAAIYGVVWGSVATGIFAATLTFFKFNCW